MGGLRGQEILIILILLILVFGWKRLPDAARSLGRSARVFKSEVEEMKKDGKGDAADETVQGRPGELHQTPHGTSPGQDSQAPPQQYPPSPSPQYQPSPQSQPQPQAQQPYQPPVQDRTTPDDPTRPVA